MADNDKPYDLYGQLHNAWLISLRVDRQGIVSAHVKEKREAPTSAVDFQQWCRLDKAPRPDGFILPCTGISLEWQREDGMWRGEWNYEGWNGDPESVTFGDPATTTYEIDCSVTTAPIETHPRFLAIAQQYGATNKYFDKVDGFLGFPKMLPQSAKDGSGDRKNPLYGVEDYYVSTLAWKVSSCCRDLPADFRKNLGLIDKPRNQGGPPLPTVSGKQNWLKTVARATWRGNIWSTQEEWALSGKDGWNKDIYRAEG